MGTHFITCACGFDIGSAQEGYEEGYHPECRPFKQAKLLAIDNLRCSVYRVETLMLLEVNLQEGMEVIVFDLTEPRRPFTPTSFPAGDMK